LKITKKQMLVASELEVKSNIMRNVLRALEKFVELEIKNVEKKLFLKSLY